MHTARLGGGDHHAILRNRRLGHAIDGRNLVVPQHVRNRALHLHEAKFLALANAAATTEGYVRPFVLDAIHESRRIECVGIWKSLFEHATHVGRARDHAAAANRVLVKHDILFHSPHQQKQWRMHSQRLGDNGSQFLHALVPIVSELRFYAAQSRVLLLEQIFNDVWPGEDLQGRPRCRDRAVVHTAEESGDQKTDNLLVSDRSPGRVTGVQDGLHEVTLLFVCLSAPLRQDGRDHLVDESARLVAFAVPGDRSVRPEHRHRQHALLEDVEQLYDTFLLRFFLCHLDPELMTHQATYARSSQQFLHRLPDVHLARVTRPALLEELGDLFLERARVRSKTLIRKAFTDEAKLARTRTVVHVVQHLRAENRHSELVHLGLVQVPVVVEKDFMGLGANEVHHVHGQKINLEATA
mmetsp:Transcript_115812/g.327611  ORF Transcript_115812/g.327611 Transcript_115812/m.327611 type:complete len:411 (+) Transcript_115812:193-1425(+)